MNENAALEFVDAINHGNVEKLGCLLTGDHLFIDSQGNQLQGKEKMMEAWKGYFALFPDYRIEIEEWMGKGSLICLFGFASATYTNKETNDNHYWKIPAAWKAIIENDLIKQWQVYADNSVVIEIVNGNR
jgi:ketosteroid isomerase-like protein